MSLRVKFAFDLGQSYQHVLNIFLQIEEKYKDNQNQDVQDILKLFKKESTCIAEWSENILESLCELQDP